MTLTIYTIAIFLAAVLLAHICVTAGPVLAGLSFVVLIICGLAVLLFEEITEGWL